MRLSTFTQHLSLVFRSDYFIILFQIGADCDHSYTYPFLWKGKGGNPFLVKVLSAPHAPSPEEEREQSWLVCGKGEPCLGLPLLLVQEHGPPSSALHFVEGRSSQPFGPFQAVWWGTSLQGLVIVVTRRTPR